MFGFDDLFAMYNYGDEGIYYYLLDFDFKDLYHECNKDLAKYYEFRLWLESIEKYY